MKNESSKRVKGKELRDRLLSECGWRSRRQKQRENFLIAVPYYVAANLPFILSLIIIIVCYFE